MLMIRKARNGNPPLTPQERAIARALVAAAKAVAEATKLNDLIRALESGSAQAAVDAVKWEAAGAALLATLPKQYYGMHSEAKAKAGRLARRLAKRAYDFGTPDPNSLNWAETRAGQLIKEWGLTSQEALRAMLAQALREGISSRDLAKMIKASGIGLTERQAAAVLRRRAVLEAQGFKGEKLLQRIARYEDQLLRYRATTIARTETTAAQIGGAQAGWQEAIKEGLINPETALQFWDATGACRECEAVEDAAKDGVRIGETFPGTDVYGPPLHPNCRCGLNLRP